MYSGIAPIIRMSKGYPAGFDLGAPTVKFFSPFPGLPLSRNGKHSVVRGTSPMQPSVPPGLMLLKTREALRNPGPWLGTLKQSETQVHLFLAGLEGLKGLSETKRLFLSRKSRFSL